MAGIDPARVMAMRAQIMERNDALQRAAGLGFDGQVGGTGAPTGPAGFGDAMRGALAQVNEMQAQSGAISEAYERGQTTDIAAVMLARQQASIGFEATMQVRNRLLSAYKDIMNMPV
ncbi:MAG TPA: flagellar hook-basal body complex protein FliE [Allosphingosinicella sp.]|jgi:flagellar hook-basal body complex protein FliE